MKCGCMRASTVGCRVLDRCGDSLGVEFSFRMLQGCRSKCVVSDDAVTLVGVGKEQLARLASVRRACTRTASG